MRPIPLLTATTLTSSKSFPPPGCSFNSPPDFESPTDGNSTTVTSYRPGFRRQRFGHRRRSIFDLDLVDAAQSGSRLPLGRKLFHSRKPGLRIRLQRNRSGRRPLTYSIAYGDRRGLRNRSRLGLPHSILLPTSSHRQNGNSDNRYEATVRVSDGNASVTLDVQVFVTDLEDVPGPIVPSTILSPPPLFN